MKRWSLFLIVVMLLSIVPAGVSFVSAAQSTVRLNPTDDSYVYETYPTRNYGSSTSIWVGYYSGQEVGFLKFDMGSLPENAQIISANVCLYNYKLYGTPIISAHAVADDDWTEASITWDTAPPWEANALDTLTITDKYAYFCWDVTSLVASEFNGDKIISIALTSDNGDSTAFNSKEYSSNIPYLEITYEVPEGPQYQSIKEIRENWESGKPVVTSGIVIGTRSSGFFIQNGTEPNSGIYVYTGSSPNVEVGDVVQVNGTTTIWKGLYEIGSPTYAVVGKAELPEPVLIKAGDMDDRYQSMLVRLEWVRVTDVDGKEITVSDETGSLLLYDYYGVMDVIKGRMLKYVEGIGYKYNVIEVYPLEYDVYIPPIKVSSLEVPSAANRNTQVTIKATLTNEGTFDENVTFLLYIDDELKLNQTVELGANSSEEVTYEWIPMELGSHVVKAEIEGYDTRYASIHIFENPSTIINTYSRYYTIRYVKEKETFDELYATYENLTSEVEACGVSLDVLSDYMELIAENKAKYDEYIVQLQELQGIAYTQSYLATKYFITARGLAITQEKLIGELNTVIPILQDALEKCQAGEEVVIEKPEGVKVLVDNGHDQYYNSGKMITLITKMKTELNWTVELNEDEFTADELKDYDIVIITNPHKDFTDEEIAALHEYVKNGGGLLVTGDWYRYIYHRTLNDLVSAFGITFNDDELMDEEVNSGAAYFPFIGEFNEHPTTKFLTSESRLYYNGDTLDITGDAVWLIRGYESSYAVDEDGNVMKEKGSKPIVAAAAEFGKGRVVVYGSSKALSDDYNGNYINSNWPFLKGVLLWLAGQI